MTFSGREKSRLFPFDVLGPHRLADGRTVVRALLPGESPADSLRRMERELVTLQRAVEAAVERYRLFAQPTRLDLGPARGEIYEIVT